MAGDAGDSFHVDHAISGYAAFSSLISVPLHTADADQLPGII